MKTRFSQKRTRLMLLLTAAALCLLIVLGTHSRTETLVCTTDRTEYLAALGWIVDPESETQQTIHIPQEFDDVYIRYNELQRQQGFDLADYAGKECTLYTYTVTNAAQDDTLIVADLYLRNDRVIAGDIHSTVLNGFMVGIR